MIPHRDASEEVRRRVRGASSLEHAARLLGVSVDEIQSNESLVVAIEVNFKFV